MNPGINTKNPVGTTRIDPDPAPKGQNEGDELDEFHELTAKLAQVRKSEPNEKRET